ncbi:ComF family protein [Bacillus taeanensis]|uniref:ComF family protein n=1 Tax=Bacillus taeanensis TaxID=273032 RepID=A0A366XPC2_9BACI|nr:ComF family protein [Bacillus taeanensis]RBW67586.1 ComF family protein [Bacillus taeanensis]
MNYCLWCDQPFFFEVSWHEVCQLAKPKKICKTCTQSLETISGEICRICGRAFKQIGADYRQGNCCYDCARWENDLVFQHVLIKNRSLYVYDDFLKEIINRFKFRGDTEMIKGIQNEWKALYKKEYQEMNIVPIPLSDELLYERGFNQSLLLAVLLEKPVYDLLKRKVHEAKQSKKTRRERLENRMNPFELKESHL